jgi:hypothetical protein
MLPGARLARWFMVLLAVLVVVSLILTAAQYG